MGLQAPLVSPGLVHCPEAYGSAFYLESKKPQGISAAYLVPMP